MPSRWEMWWSIVQISPYYHIALTFLALLGVWFLVELLIIGSRYRSGETLWSAFAKTRERRLYRHADEPAPAEQEQEALVEIVQRAALVEEPVQALVADPPPTLTPPPPPAAEPPRVRFNVDATADMIETMFLVKAGIIKVLWEQRAIEDQAGNVAGVLAIDVLIADVESTEVQKIWVLGDTRLKMG